MSKNILIKNLISKSIRLYEEHKLDILDIILFGSLVKGKDNPNDIDILIIYKNKKDLEISYKLKKLLEKNSNIPIDIVSKTYFDLFDPGFQAKEAILSEGYSLLSKSTISEGLGYKNFVLFIYELRGKNKSERMRFYYSLYGRNSVGMLKLLKAEKIADAVIICPTNNKEKMKEYLESWHLDFKEIPILIPKRLY